MDKYSTITNVVVISCLAGGVSAQVATPPPIYTPRSIAPVRYDWDPDVQRGTSSGCLGSIPSDPLDPYYNPWDDDSDWDGDGIPNRNDPDFDGDGKDDACNDRVWPTDPCSSAFPPHYCDDIAPPSAPRGGGGIGIPNPCWDRDDDGDGILNANDLDSICFNPFDPLSDRDCDGIPNLLDDDDDGDGVLDSNDRDGPGYVYNDPDSDFDMDGIVNQFDCDDDNDGVCDECDVQPFGCSNTSLKPGCVDGDPASDPACDCPQEPPPPPDGDDDSGDGPGPGPGGPYPGDHPDTDPPFVDPTPPEYGDPDWTPPDDIPDPPLNDPPSDDLCCLAITERLDDVVTMLRRLDHWAQEQLAQTNLMHQYIRYLGERLVTDPDSWRNVSTNQLEHIDQLLVYISGQLSDLNGGAPIDGGILPDGQPGDTITTSDALDELRDGLRLNVEPSLWEPPASETTPPVWDLTLNPSSFIPGWTAGAYSLTIDWSQFQIVRVAFHAVLLSLVSLNAMGMVWEEVRRYG